MKALLQITTTPVKYELQIERAKLEYEQNMIPRAEVNTTMPELKLHTKDVAVNLDTSRALASLGLRKMTDQAKHQANQGKQKLSQNIQGIVQDGKSMGEIQNDVTIGQIVSEKMFEPTDLYTAFLPSGGVDITWQPPEISTVFTPGEVEYDWQIKSNVLSYVPGSVKLEIIDRPSVDIEYVGDPIYFPKSANPNSK